MLFSGFFKIIIQEKTPNFDHDQLLILNNL